jgi:hypothetical protein
MADTAPAVTNPLAPGLATTEGRLTVAAVIIGTVLEGVGAFLSHEQVTHAGSLGWAAAVAIAGALLQLCTIYGYSKGRTLLKQQALLTGLTAALPLATSIAEAVFDKLAGEGLRGRSAGGEGWDRAASRSPGCPLRGCPERQHQDGRRFPSLTSAVLASPPLLSSMTGAQQADATGALKALSDAPLRSGYVQALATWNKWDGAAGAAGGGDYHPA